MNKPLPRRAALRLLSKRAVKCRLATSIFHRPELLAVHALRKQIAHDIAPQLAAMRVAQNAMDTATSSRRAKRDASPEMYRADLSKYGHKYSMGENDPLADLSAHNSPAFAAIQQCAAIVENNTTERQASIIAE